MLKIFFIDGLSIKYKGENNIFPLWRLGLLNYPALEFTWRMDYASTPSLKGLCILNFLEFQAITAFLAYLLRLKLIFQWQLTISSVKIYENFINPVNKNMNFVVKNVSMLMPYLGARRSLFLIINVFYRFVKLFTIDNCKQSSRYRLNMFQVNYSCFWLDFLYFKFNIARWLCLRNGACNFRPYIFYTNLMTTRKGLLIFI